MAETFCACVVKGGPKHPWKMLVSRAGGQLLSLGETIIGGDRTDHSLEVP